jgi:hypothetical protein
MQIETSASAGFDLVPNLELRGIDKRPSGGVPDRVPAGCIEDRSVREGHEHHGMLARMPYELKDPLSLRLPGDGVGGANLVPDLHVRDRILRPVEHGDRGVAGEAV